MAFFLSKINYNFENFISLLNNDEYKRYKSFRYKEDARLYIASHVMLKMILASQTNISIKEIDDNLVFNKFKKPYLVNKNLFFSLSHTKNFFTIAISDKEIGIDVENINHINFKWEDFNSIWSKAEQKALEKLVTKNKNLFYQLWVRKEAVCKAYGKGIFIPLENIVLPINNIMKNKERILLVDDDKLYFYSGNDIDLPTGFYGYIAGKNLSPISRIDKIYTNEQFANLLLEIN